MTAPEGEDLSKPLANPIWNWMSVIGALVVIAAATAAVFFLLLGTVSGDDSGYAGLMVLPPVAAGAVGLALLIAGYLRERWRQKRERHSSFHERWVIDPARVVRGVSPAVIGLIVVVGTLFVLGGGAGSLALVKHTESNSFCSDTCHPVMRPEGTVYHDSPHSEVDCVECHVGSGSGSFINAKLNGLVQVYKMMSGEIAKPIPTPIHNRMTSARMCGQCHTAERLDEYKVVSRSYFLADEDSEEVRLRMLMRIGRNHDADSERSSGVHFHTMAGNRVQFIARDKRGQDIAWVRVLRDDGEIRVFENEDDPLTDEQIESLPVREMECLDCHSRPAHRFPSAVESVNAAMADGRLPTDVPYLKAGAVAALDGDYDSESEALAGLGDALREFYEEWYEDELEENSEALDAVVPALGEIYRDTIFPEMKASWRAHPNNIGHRDWPGCFRCHNDVMVDGEGEAIFTDCYRCHSILSQNGEVVSVESFTQGLDFVHPDDWDTIEEFTLCSDCHTGGVDVYE